MFFLEKGVNIVRRESIFDLLALSRGSPFLRVPLPDLQPEDVITRVVEQLVQHLSGVRRSLRIVSGEANFQIFDHPEFLRLMETLARRDVVIQVVVGPVISRSPQKESPQIFHLAQDGVLTLYFRATRGVAVETFICDNAYAVVEWKIAPQSLFSERMNFTRISCDDNWKEFGQVQERFVKQFSYDEYVLDPWSAFLVLFPQEILGIINLLGEPYVYETLSLSDLVPLLQSFRKSAVVQTG